MANQYETRDKPRLTGTFTSSGVAADPTAVVIEVKDPNGVITGYAYGLSDQGNWSASANSPTLADGTGTAGHYYTSTTAGAVDFGNGSISFAVDDYVYYNGDVWQVLHAPSSTAITKSDTGIYYIDRYLDDVGEYFYRIEGVGTGQSADEDYLTASERTV